MLATKKVHKEDGILLRCCFWVKFQEQIAKCEQVLYREQVSMNCFPTDPFFFRLLQANGVELTGNKLYGSFDQVP